MLDELYDALKTLPSLLKDRSRWDSLIVNRRKPHTYRVFTTLDSGCRLCLHKFDQCNTDEAFPHPHPWPGAFIVLSGKYMMHTWYSKDREDNEPEHVATFVMNKYSSYEIDNPLTWHAVIPMGTVHTVMINKEPWDSSVAHKSVKTTKGKDLDKMPEDELINHLGIFKKLIRDFRNSETSQ